MNLNALRQLTHVYVDQANYKTALFWADKCVTLSKGDIVDYYWLLHIHVINGQYLRAIQIIQSKNLNQVHIIFIYLLAKCYAERKVWVEALCTIEHMNEENHETFDENIVGLPTKNIRSCLHLLCGKVYEALSNMKMAKMYYVQALEADIYCSEAFDLLMNQYMLSREEELQLLERLANSQQWSDKEKEFILCLYRGRIVKHGETEVKLDPDMEVLQSNADVMLNDAKQYYYRTDFHACYKITSRILQDDTFHEECIPFHVACLMELNKTNELFRLSRIFVNDYPSSPAAWYAVGCYYLLVENYLQARQHFNKAISLRNSYGLAWLGFAHSFAAQAEPDRAMAAYSRASNCMPGSHFPLMYIGKEYATSNNYQVAASFFNKALQIAPDDPYIEHEIGTAAFCNGDLVTAKKHFMYALQVFERSDQNSVPEAWEALLNNLGHTCRKLGLYDEALKYHKLSLGLLPRNHATFAAIGFTYSLMGNHKTALEYYDKATAIKKDDTFTLQMINNTVELLAAETIDIPKAITGKAPSSNVKLKSYVHSLGDSNMSLDE